MKSSPEEIASKCYDIQATLGSKQVSEFDLLPTIGMMISLSLHIRGLPLIKFEKFRMVAHYYFNIPSYSVKDIVLKLAELEFVELDMEGETIRSVLPTVPYFENVYDRIGEYAGVSSGFNEFEQLALLLLTKLSSSPEEKSRIYSLGAEKKLLDRNLTIGKEGGYIINKRARGKDIFLSPLFFSENSELFTDMVAKSGSSKIQKLLELVKKAQGWPLSLVEKDKAINGEPITGEELNLLKRLALDGCVKPPSITAPHSGTNHFMFSPTPGNSKLSPSKREIYERAMALVSAMRQGQLLADKYAIRNPVWILKALKSNGYLKPTTEASVQYKSLVLLKVGRLEEVKPGWHRFYINEKAEENMEALDLAIGILTTGDVSNMEINTDARIALEKDQTYIESIISSSKLRETETVSLSEDMQEEIDNLLLNGVSYD